MVSHAASLAFERMTGSGNAFGDAWARDRGPRERRNQEPADENFDFRDVQRMRRRLPRLSAIFLPHGPAEAEPVVSAPAAGTGPAHRQHGQGPIALPGVIGRLNHGLIVG
jgi:hypothetical protein